MYRQVLKHVDHSDYDSVINPFLESGYIITSIQSDGHSGCWVLLSLGCPYNYVTPIVPKSKDSIEPIDMDTING